MGACLLIESIRTVKTMNSAAITIVLLIIISLGPALAQPAEIYDISANVAGRFLTFHPDARGEAVGQAYSSLADGISGTCWNPAGLAFSDGIEFAEQGYLVPSVGWDTNWSGDIEFRFVGASIRIGSLWEHIPLGTFAVWQRRVDYSDIVIRGDWSDHYLGDLTQDAFAVTYAQHFWNSLALGVTYKHVSSEWADRSAWANPNWPGDYDGNSWDMGVLYRSKTALSDLLTLEVNAAFGERNLGKVKPEGGSDKSRYNLPLHHFVGLAPTMCLAGGDFEMTLAVERTSARETRDWQTHTGVEVAVLDGVFLRFGLYEDYDSSDWIYTRGTGITLRYGGLIGVSHDWARTSAHADSKEVDLHVLSVTLLRTSRGIDLKPFVERYLR
jgi:hypothetical protein